MTRAGDGGAKKARSSEADLATRLEEAQLGGVVEGRGHAQVAAHDDGLVQDAAWGAAHQRRGRRLRSV